MYVCRNPIHHPAEKAQSRPDREARVLTPRGKVRFLSHPRGVREPKFSWYEVRCNPVRKRWREPLVLLGFLMLFEIWLGGLDSNQDNQIQNLMYCRLYDLPAEGDKNAAGRQTTRSASPADISTLFMNSNSVNRARSEGRQESKCLCGS